MKKALIYRAYIEILYFVLLYLTIFYFQFWCPGRDSNSHACWARDFESLVSTISPPGQRFENSINTKLKLQLIWLIFVFFVVKTQLPV